MGRRQINFYERQYYFLSNFSAFRVNHLGIDWMTAEHAYQAARCDLSSDDGMHAHKSIMYARSAYEAKEIAHACPHVRPDMSDEKKLLLMEEVLRAKTLQHEVIRDGLSLMYPDVTIVENSPTDWFWGTGQDGSGSNNLGKIWMKIRKEIQTNTFHT